MKTLLLIAFVAAFIGLIISVVALLKLIPTRKKQVFQETDR
jgi:hypothetical protein